MLSVGGPPGDRAQRLGLLGFEQAVAVRRSALAGNHRRLTELAARPDVTVVPAHDPVVFDELAAADATRLLTPHLDWAGTRVDGAVEPRICPGQHGQRTGRRTPWATRRVF